MIADHHLGERHQGNKELQYGVIKCCDNDKHAMTGGTPPLGLEQGSFHGEIENSEFSPAGQNSLPFLIEPQEIKAIWLVLKENKQSRNELSQPI